MSFFKCYILWLFCRDIRLCELLYSSRHKIYFGSSCQWVEKVGISWIWLSRLSVIHKEFLDMKMNIPWIDFTCIKLGSTLVVLSVFNSQPTFHDNFLEDHYNILQENGSEKKENIFVWKKKCINNTFNVSLRGNLLDMVAWSWGLIKDKLACKCLTKILSMPWWNHWLFML